MGMNRRVVVVWEGTAGKACWPGFFCSQCLHPRLPPCAAAPQAFSLARSWLPLLAGTAAAGAQAAATSAAAGAEAAAAAAAMASSEAVQAAAAAATAGVDAAQAAAAGIKAAQAATAGIQAAQSAAAAAADAQALQAAAAGAEAAVQAAARGSGLGFVLQTMLILTAGATICKWISQAVEQHGCAHSPCGWPLPLAQ